MSDSVPHLTPATPHHGPTLEVGGVPFGPALAVWLYVMLGGSALLALSARHFPGMIPHSLELAAPMLFLAFLIGFSLYRLRLVQARKYPAFKAFFQVGAALLFFTLLLPGAKSHYQGPQRGLEDLLADSDPAVRAMAAELFGYRPDGASHAARLVAALQDPDPTVRAEAHRSLVRINGTDLGSPENSQGLKAWEERFH